jgi:hypothetical protein
MNVLGKISTKRGRTSLDIRERAAGTDGQRREHREDLLAEVALDQLGRRLGLVAGNDPDPVLGELRPDHL